MSFPWTLILWCGLAATLSAGLTLLVARWSGLTALSVTRAIGVLWLRRAHPSAFPGAATFAVVGTVVLPTLYAAAFEVVGRAEAETGLLFGAVQAALALGAVLVAVRRQIPGHRHLRPFLPRDDLFAPLVWLVAHLVYGFVLGYVYVAIS